MKYILLSLLSIISISLAGQSAQSIVDNAYKVARSQGEDQKILAHMDIQNAAGKSTMERELVVLRKNVKGSEDQLWYAYFKKPADTRKMVFMVHKHADKDDDRWLYLPAMDLEKRLASSDKRSSFAGSQFFYEDITGRYPTEDTHEKLEDINGNHQIKSTPKDKGEVEFAYYISEIDTNNGLIHKRVFYDEGGKAQREYKLISHDTVQGYTTYKKFSMTDLSSGNRTVTTYSDVAYDLGIPADVFTEKSLRRTPRKWLRK